ncbi:hypothetical protein CEY16_06895 [Halalkalibacillus sediminis]|uniref:Uncharacterized protein n=1 Tax=Halalkalibacillus sediminis TaxID=2018042 RepID=A0A2I0QTJ8_9BACI|nr:hypothetical protein [Halalkalibacillus sediminis]PKR77656.1 hypothetical protein CEY16_06895 [Halalkalibacillus sediminis]
MRNQLSFARINFIIGIAFLIISLMQTDQMHILSFAVIGLSLLFVSHLNRKPRPQGFERMTRE